MGNLFSKADLIENKKKKKPYSSVTYTTGDPDLNIAHFNKLMGTDINITDSNSVETTDTTATDNTSDGSSDGGGLSESSDISGGHSKQRFRPKETKRYVRRYYIKPQEIFCSNKDDILMALTEFVDQDMTIYTMLNLGDTKDVTKLTDHDVIYRYEDGVLYDKNYVRIMDYDLFIKHEEDRDLVDVNSSSDRTISKVYQDRITGLTDNSIDLKETYCQNEFDLDFDDYNVYGERLLEGKVVDDCCVICGEKIDGFGKDASPYKEGTCCEACYKKFVEPEEAQ